MPHVDDGLLHTYLDGELDGAERARVLAHLSECATCRTRLEEDRALAARARDLLGRAAPPTRATPTFAPVRRSYALRWRVPAAWAATVTIAFAVGWYAQGEQLRRELATAMTPPTASAPPPAASPPATSAAKLKGAVAPQPAAEPRASSGQRQDAPRQRAAVPPAPAEVQSAPAVPSAATETAALRDEFAAWPALNADEARAVLGRDPVLLPGRAVRRMARSPTDGGVVLVEQEWTEGIVLRLYERRAIEAGLNAVEPRSEVTRGRSQTAQPAPSAPPLRRENLARYVSSLRVEIAGPLAADSLARLLGSVE